MNEVFPPASGLSTTKTIEFLNAKTSEAIATVLDYLLRARELESTPSKMAMADQAAQAMRMLLTSVYARGGSDAITMVENMADGMISGLDYGKDPWEL